MIKTIQPLPSAAILNELPLYYAYRMVESQDPGKARKGFLIGMAAVPLSAALTPLTIVADIVIGVVEALFMLLAKQPAADIKNHLICKLVASPVQQTVSALVKIAFTFLPLPLLPLLLWTYIYPFSQTVVTYLPDSVNHNSYNTFITEQSL